MPSPPSSPSVPPTLHRTGLLLSLARIIILHRRHHTVVIISFSHHWPSHGRPMSAFTSFTSHCRHCGTSSGYHITARVRCAGRVVTPYRIFLHRPSPISGLAFTTAFRPGLPGHFFPMPTPPRLGGVVSAHHGSLLLACLTRSRPPSVSIQHCLITSPFVVGVMSSQHHAGNTTRSSFSPRHPTTVKANITWTVLLAFEEGIVSAWHILPPRRRILSSVNAYTS